MCSILFIQENKYCVRANFSWDITKVNVHLFKKINMVSGLYFPVVPVSLLFCVACVNKGQQAELMFRCWTNFYLLLLYLHLLMRSMEDLSMVLVKPLKVSSTNCLLFNSQHCEQQRVKNSSNLNKTFFHIILPVVLIQKHTNIRKLHRLRVQTVNDVLAEFLKPLPISLLFEYYEQPTSDSVDIKGGNQF